MKKVTILLIAFFFISALGYAQIKKQIISIEEKGGTINIKTPINDIKKYDTTKDIIIRPLNTIAKLTFILKDNKGILITGGVVKDKPTQGEWIIPRLGSKKTLNLEIQVNDVTKNTISDIGKDFKASSVAVKPQSGSTINTVSASSAYDYFSNMTNIKTYDRENDDAFFYFDEKGVLAIAAPVNIDSDDFITIYLAAPKSKLSNYTIEVIGDYTPSDLLIRQAESISDNNQAFGSKIPYNHISRKFGPFTDNATINIYYSENETRKLLNSMTVKINPLVHVAIGASFVSTDLSKPSFDIFPVSGTSNNTINQVNSGNRTLATFNVIFYWKPTIEWLKSKLKDKSHITRGRDILKEGQFWERLNPTFGVSLNDEWRENFFFGATFEFTRGGSITAGWHYGKVQKLVDKDFVLGETVFTGTKDDIKLTDEWDTGFFFGITLDTRIFNRLLSRN